MKLMKLIPTIAFVLLLVGGLNWGLYGLFQFDLVAKLFGSIPWLATTTYVLIGVSALIVAFKKFL